MWGQGKQGEKSQCDDSTCPYTLLSTKHIHMEFSFELNDSLTRMKVVTVTIDDKTGSQRLGSQLEVTELLNGRADTPVEGFGLETTLFCGQNPGPWVTTMGLGKYTHLINRKSLIPALFLYLAFKKYKEESLDY